MLTVVTHTRNERPELLRRCAASVEAALPPGAKHVIIECLHDFALARFKARELDDIIAFVDDDDYISADSLRLCMAALNDTGAGAAFTNEVLVDIHGSVRSVDRTRRLYGNVSKHPRTIHHLTLMRTKFIDDRALALDAEFGLGIDWFMKASAALQGSAVHVPIDGAFWTKHQDQLTSTVAGTYSGSIQAMGARIAEFFPHEQGLIPLHEPKS